MSGNLTAPAATVSVAIELDADRAIGAVLSAVGVASAVADCGPAIRFHGDHDTDPRNLCHTTAPEPYSTATCVTVVVDPRLLTSSIPDRAEGTLVAFDQ